MNLNQVTIPVRNMAVAVDFYTALGMTLIVDTPHYARFSCPQGDTTFSLSLNDEDSQNGAIIYFESEQLDDWVKELKTKGFTFLQEPQDQRYLWKEAVLADPSDNKIKLYWAGENRLNPPWKVRTDK